jgi:hypothetical protein
MTVAIESKNEYRLKLSASRFSLLRSLAVEKLIKQLSMYSAF